VNDLSSSVRHLHAVAMVWPGFFSNFGCGQMAGPNGLAPHRLDAKSVDEPMFAIASHHHFSGHHAKGAAGEWLVRYPLFEITGGDAKMLILSSIH